MNYSKLLNEKEKSFEEIITFMREKEEKHRKEMTELESEALRLQGEYRLLKELQDSQEPVENMSADQLINEFETEMDKIESK